MKAGDRIRITGAAGTVVGQLVDVRAPADLPAITGAPAWPAIAILNEWNVSRVAVIRYRIRKQDGTSQMVAFTALEVASRWFDLRGEELTIVPQPTGGARVRRLYG